MLSGHCQISLVNGSPMKLGCQSIPAGGVMAGFSAFWTSVLRGQSVLDKIKCRAARGQAFKIPEWLLFSRACAPVAQVDRAAVS